MVAQACIFFSRKNNNFLVHSKMVPVVGYVLLYRINITIGR